MAQVLEVLPEVFVEVSLCVSIVLWNVLLCNVVQAV